VRRAVQSWQLLEWVNRRFPHAFISSKKAELPTLSIAPKRPLTFGPQRKELIIPYGPHPFSGPSGRLVVCGQNPLSLNPAGFVDRRRLVVQRRVRPPRIGLHPPGCTGGARFLKGAKPVLIQAFLPKPGIECLDEGSVSRRPRPVKCQRHTVTWMPTRTNCTSSWRRTGFTAFFGGPSGACVYPTSGPPRAG
jgi:hypothetical protein